MRLLRRHGELCGLPRNFVIYDQDDQKLMLTRTMTGLGISKDRMDVRRVQKYVNGCKQKNQTPDEAQAADGRRHDDPCVGVHREYERRMREARAVDFADLLMLPLRLMTEVSMVAAEYQSRWRYVLVDEFQDTNQVQYDLLKAVLNPEQRICVVGDDDQSIYRWRGAEVANILGFDRDFEGTTVIRLEQNYRSSGNILEVAGTLISENTSRHDKTLWTERDAGELVRLHHAATDTDEAEYIGRRIVALRDEYALREMAILYRTHAQSRVLEDALRRRGIAYTVIGGLRFYDRAEVKDVLGYLRVALNPADIVSFERIFNTPPRGIGAKTVAAIHTHATDRGVTFWEAVQEVADKGSTRQKKALGPFVTLIGELLAIAADQPAFVVAQAVLDRTEYRQRLRAEGTVEAQVRIDNVGELLNALDEFAETTGDPSLAGFLEQVALVANVDRADLDTDRVVMMTAHTAKGLEFDVVFLGGLEHELMPHFNSLEDPAAVEEERRLAYVAMTRARHYLHLSLADQRRKFGRQESTIPSKFIERLPSQCVLVDGGGIKRRRFVDDFDPAPSWSRQQRRRGRLSASAGGANDTFSQEMPDYEEFSQEEPQLLGPHAPVFHSTFGHGTVTSVQGEGPKARVAVRFDSGVEKRILARFLTLST